MDANSARSDRLIQEATGIKVSVVVPNYNHAPFFRQRLDSILGQSFRDFEIVYLDDASTDAANSGSPFKHWTSCKSLLLSLRHSRGGQIYLHRRLVIVAA